MIIPITTSKTLVPFLHAIESVSEVYIDTEADSLHHYYEKVCLLQFTLFQNDSNVLSNFIVDPLAKLDLQPLFESLQTKLLVFHGADYDLRMLRADFDFVPSHIFDTMLAARLAGHTALGLDGLVEKYTGQHLDHAIQKADWSQRPLPSRFLNYAVDDTKFLPQITRNLRNELASLGRTEWHRQQCQQLIKLSAIKRSKNADEEWKIKGSSNLDCQSLAILRELWRWRDQEAQNWDRPSYMVCNNEKLLEWVVWAKDHPHANFHQAFVLPKRWPPRRSHALCAALKRAWLLTSSDWPLPTPRGKRPSYNPPFKIRLGNLRTARNKIAREMNLTPFILASNSTLEAIASRNPKTIQDFEAIEKWLSAQTEFLGQIFLEACIKT